MNMKKILAFALCLVLVAGLSIAGTIAYLTSITGTLENTFTVGNVTITLDEAKVVNGQVSEERITTGGNAYKLMPGSTYTKDPIVTVKANSEDCYLFVKFVEEGNASTYLTYTSNLKAPEWTQGNGTDIPSNVWYRAVASSTSDQAWHLLDGDKITINATTVTTGSMSTAANAKLSYTAYAIQQDNLTVEQAWAQVKPAN